MLYLILSMLMIRPGVHGGLSDGSASRPSNAGSLSLRLHDDASPSGNSHLPDMDEASKLRLLEIRNPLLSPQEIASREECRRLGTEALIARLQNVSREAIGLRSTPGDSDGFIAEEAPALVGKNAAPAAPAASAEMKELARRGVAALPLLIRRLTDARETSLTIGPAPGVNWFSNEYQGRYSGDDGRYKDVNLRWDGGSWSGRTFMGGYRVRVADICFVIIGQIVNRDLHVTRFHPSFGLVVNSPIEMPALVEAVKKDWSGLTAQTHKESLLEDMKSASEKIRNGAFARLSFYYPEALKELKQP